MEKKLRDYDPPTSFTVALVLFTVLLGGVAYGINDYLKRDYNRKAGERVESIEVVPTPKGLNPAEIKSPPVKVDIIPICWTRTPGVKDYEYHVLVVTRTSRPKENGYVEIISETTSVIPATYGAVQNVKSTGIPSCL